MCSTTQASSQRGKSLEGQAEPKEVASGVAPFIFAASRIELRSATVWGRIRDENDTRSKELGMNPTIIWELLKETVSEWLEDKAPRLAAALAYYTNSC